MFESNFPVDKGSYSYAVGWNAFKRLAAGASAAEKAELFSGTATRFYRLSLAADRGRAFDLFGRIALVTGLRCAAGGGGRIFGGIAVYLMSDAAAYHR